MYWLHVTAATRAFTRSSAVAERPRDASCLSVVSCNIPTAQFLPRDAIHKRGICRHAVSGRLSVCMSVTFVSCAKMNKDIFEIFSPPGSQAILVFPHQTGWRYSDGNPLTRASNARGYEKMTIVDQYLAPSQKHAARQLVSIKFSFHPYNICWLPQGRPQGKQKCDKNSDFCIDLSMV